MIPRRVVCWVLGHAWLRVQVRQWSHDAVLWEFTRYRCSRCGATMPKTSR